MFRGYEKGKQLGEPDSRWFRVECEWHDDNRVLPYAMLTRPGQYLAGAYPCMRFVSIEQSKIKTVFRSAKIIFERAMDNARQQAGKPVNLALDVYAGDYGEVVERLIRREGYVFDKSVAVPDFQARNAVGELCVEATTVNPSRNGKQEVVPPPQIETPEQVTAFQQQYMPIRYAGPLSAKLAKRYWDKDHIKGRAQGRRKSRTAGLTAGLHSSHHSPKPHGNWRNSRIE